MITDMLCNASSYHGLGERFAKAFTYLKETDLAALAPGKYAVDGEDIFVMIQEYETKDLSAGKWEAHKKYADIQYLLAGKERMGYAEIGGMGGCEDQTPAKDMLIYQTDNGTGTFVRHTAGQFSIFFPQDAHMPNIADGEKTANKKAVVKVLLG